MTESKHQREEFALHTMFGRELPPVPDDGFSNRVAGRLRRQTWRRRLILISAAVIGLVIALPAVAPLLSALGASATAFAATVEESDALGQFRFLTTLLPVRETAEAAGEELQGVGVRLNALEWLGKYQMFLLAGLLAAATAVTARLFER